MSGELPRIAADLVALLTSRKVTVATAEATTGGLIGHCVVAVPGSSTVFRGGIAPYSNAAKIRLGVPGAILREHGAVSREAVEALAMAAREWFEVDVAIAETGIAGPTGGNDARPVGTFWIAVATRSAVTSRRFNFEGNRVQSQEAATAAAMQLTLGVLGPGSDG